MIQHHKIRMVFVPSSYFFQFYSYFKLPRCKVLAWYYVRGSQSAAHMPRMALGNILGAPQAPGNPGNKAENKTEEHFLPYNYSILAVRAATETTTL